MNKCNWSCNTVEDPFGRVCIPNRLEYVNLKVFDMIKGINDLKALSKHISYECRCEFDGRKYNSRQKWNNYKYQCDYIKPIRHRACEEEYSWNLNTCACECDKDCNIGENLKNCGWTKNLVDDLVVTCDEIEDTPESASINRSDEIIAYYCCYISNCVFPFAGCYVVQSYMERGLTIPCLLSY